MTRYLSAWADKFIEQAQSQGHDVYILKETNANKAKFQGMVKKTKPKVIFINGHGDKDRIAGQDHKIIVDFKSASIFKEAMVYAVSCKSAQILGAQAVALGAKGYVGYTQDFILVSQPGKTAHPKDDKTAALFLDPSNQVISVITKGHSAKDAVKKGKNAFGHSITAALNSDVQSDDDKYIPYLMWDRQFLTAC
jgi:hypothetical protein